jgi:phosphoglycerate dehydrogenase-like enzyme
MFAEDILRSLRVAGGLAACALDVTDPEPLPADHELRREPRVIITPHISGVFDGYFDAGADVLLANVDRLRQGLRPYNLVDLVKGY